MEIGERFGSSFDDVRRDLRPVVVVLLFDAVVLATLGVLVGIVTGGLPATRFLPFSVAGALPSFSDVVHVQATALASAGTMRGTWIAGALAVLLAPVAAWLEGGLVGVLRSAYVEREEGALLPRFREAADASFRPLLAYRLLLHGALVAGFVAGVRFPGYHQVLGALVLRFLLVFTPFVVVFERESAWGAMKRSVSIVADHLATALVMLLFLLLVTGGFSALAREISGHVGAWVLVPGIIVYAPVGTALAVFVMKVYLGLHPAVHEPAKAAPAGAPAPG